MAGKPFKKKSKNVSRKLKRSRTFGEGIHQGEITTSEYIKTKSNKDAIKLCIYDKSSGKKGVFRIIFDTELGEFLVDGLLDCIDEEESVIEDLVGVTIGFEAKYNDTFLNLKSIFPGDEELGDSEFEDNELEDDEFEDY